MMNLVYLLVYDVIGIICWLGGAAILIKLLGDKYGYDVMGEALDLWLEESLNEMGVTFKACAILSLILVIIAWPLFLPIGYYGEYRGVSEWCEFIIEENKLEEKEEEDEYPWGTYEVPRD